MICLESCGIARQGKVVIYQFQADGFYFKRTKGQFDLVLVDVQRFDVFLQHIGLSSSLYREGGGEYTLGSSMHGLV